MASRTAPRLKPFLSLHDATFRLGDRLVFERTNWQFHQGEQWAIVGANGSGKSILADGLRGRLPLVYGELRYHFRPPKKLSHEEAIGHVAFEDRKSELHGAVVQSRWDSFEEEAALSVGEFLSYERVMEVNPFEVDSRHKLARRSFGQRLRRAIGLFQIGGFLSRTLLSLSNGERQRVQLARALAQPLRLLILDEPYTGLDKATREYFHRMLERLLQTDLKILVITARGEELPKHITHLLLVDKCRVVAAGLKEEVWARHNGRTRFEKKRALAGAVGGLGRNAPTPARKRRQTGMRRQSRPEICAAGDTLVELRDVTVRYGDIVILDRINWVVREGESWVLLGPNGSGKTTLLSLIQGDHPQAYGNNVTVFGRQRGTGESVWEIKKRIGWVSPELQLHFDDTVSVLEVVLSGFQETIGVFEPPTRPQKSAARRWLRRFDLLAQAGQPLFSLSAGLQRMTLLARALVKTPRLLILDEPCQGLDPGHRELIIRSVDGLIREGAVTAIFVTHRPEEIPRSIGQVLRLGLTRRAL